jgi:hypothetical protein
MMEYMNDSNRRLRLVGIGLVVGLVIIGIWIFISIRRSPAQITPFVQEVSLKRGDTSLTLNRQGTLTVTIPEGVFQQQWDEERVAAFFARFEGQDFSAYRAYDEHVDGYFLTLTNSDGKSLTVLIPIGDVTIPDVVEELVQTLEEIISSTPTPTPTPIPIPTVYHPSPTPTPTPTPAPGVPTPTPTPSGGTGAEAEPPYKIPFVCDFLGPDILPDIISETVCTPE